MRGMVLGFDETTGVGMASCDAGNRFSFSRSDWRAATAPMNGLRVDFAGMDGKAREIYPVTEQQNTLLPAPKSEAAKQATTFGGISLGCAIGGVLIPVIGLVLSIAAVVFGVKGFKAGRGGNDQAGFLMSIFGMIIAGGTILFWVTSFVLLSTIATGVGMAARSTGAW